MQTGGDFSGFFQLTIMNDQMFNLKICQFEDLKMFLV